MIWVTIPVDNPNDTDGTREYLEILRIRKPNDEYAAQAAAHDRIVLRCGGDVRERAIDRREEVGGRVWRPNTIPLKGVVHLRLGANPDDKRGHLPETRAELVAKRGPRDTGIGVRIGLSLTSIELGGERGRQRRSGSGVETVPESANERDALLRCEGF